MCVKISGLVKVVCACVKILCLVKVVNARRIAKDVGIGRQLNKLLHVLSTNEWLPAVLAQAINSGFGAKAL